MTKPELDSLKSTLSTFDYYFRYVDDTFIICDMKTDIEEIIDSFNKAHEAISFTYELEANDSIHFLDILLSRRPDGTIQRRQYRKPTWVGQYTHFDSFVPIKYKRNLVRCLTTRAKRICTEDTLSQELENIKNTLRQNGYPESFLRKQMNKEFVREVTTTAEKKPLYLRLRFKGDVSSEVVTSKLKRIIQRTFPAADLKLMFNTRPILMQQAKDKLPSSTTSMCVYKFNCSCGVSYIGRTTRRLSKRIKEHLPSWLGKGVVKTINSSILEHLVNNNHLVNKDEAFKVFYRIPINLPKGTRIRLLNIAEAIGIKLMKPELCVQKKLVQTLFLPWPRLQTVDLNIQS